MHCLVDFCYYSVFVVCLICDCHDWLTNFVYEWSGNSSDLSCIHIETSTSLALSRYSLYISIAVQRPFTTSHAYEYGLSVNFTCTSSFCAGCVFIQLVQYGRRSWPGSEPSTLEIDVYVRRYALFVVLARNDDDDDDVDPPYVNIARSALC